MAHPTVTHPSTAAEVPLDPDRVICSTISLRHLPLAPALEVIAGLGFTEIDLGALPGVCDHVPYALTTAAVQEVAATVLASGLTVCSVNADVGDLNRPLGPAEDAARREHVDRLLELCVAIDSNGLVLPNGALQHEPVVSLEDDLALVAEQLGAIQATCTDAGIDLWVEAPHFFRLGYDVARTRALAQLLPADLGLICDVSHIVASGGSPRAFVREFTDRIRHVHLRDAEPGYIHHSIGKGQVDFADLVAVLADVGYAGKLSLELETRDVTDEERPARALAAGRYVSSLLRAAGRLHP